MASVAVDDKTGPSAALPRSLKLTVTTATEAAPVGVQNDGYWGIPVRPQTAYAGSFYAKTDCAGVPVTLSLVNDQPVRRPPRHGHGPRQRLEAIQIHAKTAQAPVTANNHLILTIPRRQPCGSTWYRCSHPLSRSVNGNRIDLMEKLAAMHPKFLRLPGGNYLEGDHIADRFEWKKTIGPLVDRPTHPSPWHYRSSDGMGLLEFLEWCEDLNMEPVLAVYAGYSLAQDHVDPGPALEPYIRCDRRD